MIWRVKSTVRGVGETERACGDIEDRLDALNRDRMHHIHTIMRDLASGWDERLDREVDLLRRAGRAQAEMRAARRAVGKGIGGGGSPPSGAAAKDGGLRLVVSSRFLRDCWMFLKGDEEGRERMHFVTGVVDEDGSRHLSLMEKVPFSQQSTGFVAAERAHAHRLLMELEADGHPFLAMFHVHPSSSEAGTTPSSTDYANQARYLKLGWTETIGGIFSQDGYIRLFTTGEPFSVTVFGNRIAVVSRKERETILKLEI